MRSEVEAAYDQAWDRFQTVLEELVAELPALRTPLGEECVPVTGAMARSMVRACAPHRPLFITPMAAVAGAVADAVLAAVPRRVFCRPKAENLSTSLWARQLRRKDKGQTSR